ncbi:Aste57867_19324 [Aphanomyces stellatus]|uniref:Aste57867_19324 protein n=1 Tax=Aphanomyces stellatus TaxID=120398 RepID=A0A485LD21_9STRA|nr:hypothetical protein As57867_019260 [Aphanomyces stellatus]KAF0710208.1 hypothetical protein As57867_005562 [Aphanomyces stellatus]VFT82622.1 Aste57867_5575 [Aphanomyces stellatus]VFT96041.1 Aste57867_19324 [Aphanomyces stellatus]
MITIKFTFINQVFPRHSLSKSQTFDCLRRRHHDNNDDIEKACDELKQRFEMTDLGQLESILADLYTNYEAIELLLGEAATLWETRLTDRSLIGVVKKLMATLRGYTLPFPIVEALDNTSSFPTTPSTQFEICITLYSPKIGTFWSTTASRTATVSW